MHWVLWDEERPRIKAGMGDKWLSRLYMMSVHIKRLEEVTKFINKWIEEFGKNPFHLLLLFEK